MVDHGLSGIGEPKLRPDQAVEVGRGDPDEQRGEVATDDLDQRARLELADGAAVDALDHRRALGQHLEPDHLVGVQHQRAVEDHVRRDRGQQQRVHPRRDDRAARREAVGGGARRGRDDQPVGRVAREQPLADVDGERGQPFPCGLLEHHVVDGQIRGDHLAADHDPGAQGGAALHPVMPGPDRLQRVGEAVRLDLGEEAEPAEVHAEHGHLRLQHEPERAQQRAVAAEHHHQVEPDRELLRPEAGDVVAEAAALVVQGAQLDPPLGRPAGQLLAQVQRGRPARVHDRADPPRRPAPGHLDASPAARASAAWAAWAGAAPACAPAAGASAGWAEGPPRRGSSAPSATAAARAASSSGPAPARSHRNSSTLPEGPGSGEGHTPAAPRPSSAAAAATDRTAPAHARGSRTTPPLPTASLPASNCGLTSSSRSPPGRVAAARAGSTSRSEMNDRSATVRSTWPPIASASRKRTLRPSCTWTRGWLRSRASSCPWPTSTAITRAAPRSSSTSVKPPVDAPASRQRRPATSIPRRSSVGSSLPPPRLAQRRPGEASWIGSAAATILDGLAAGAPETSTRPAATASAASGWRARSVSSSAASAASTRSESGPSGSPKGRGTLTRASSKAFSGNRDVDGRWPLAEPHPEPAYSPWLGSCPVFGELRRVVRPEPPAARPEAASPVDALLRVVVPPEAVLEVEPLEAVVREPPVLEGVLLPRAPPPAAGRSAACSRARTRCWSRATSSLVAMPSPLSWRLTSRWTSRLMVSRLRWVRRTRSSAKRPTWPDCSSPCLANREARRSALVLVISVKLAIAWRYCSRALATSPPPHASKQWNLGQIVHHVRTDSPAGIRAGQRGQPGDPWRQRVRSPGGDQGRGGQGDRAADGAAGRQPGQRPLGHPRPQGDGLPGHRHRRELVLGDRGRQGFTAHRGPAARRAGRRAPQIALR